MYKLFVGGLPFSTSESELEDLFGQYGTISSLFIVKDRETGRSKGFGFVEYENEEDGKKAEAEMNGSDMNGRTITVNQAKPKTDSRQNFRN